MSNEPVTTKPTEALQEIARVRDEILRCDQELIRVIAHRRRLVLEVGEVKKRIGLPVTDPGREAAVVRRAAEMAREAGLDEELVRDLIWKIMASARDEQRGQSEGAEPGEAT